MGSELLRLLITGDGGQDLIEYTLIMAFICLAAAAFYIGVGQNVDTIWSVVNSRLANAASAGASSSS